jgi:TP901 family phage tail tape measure protein
VSDVNANIGINIDASPALAELKNLQRQLATFHSQVAKGSASASIAQKNLQTNLLNAVNATGKFQAQMGLVRTSTESFTHALENNKLSMGQYFKYAGASTKTFGRLFKSEFDTIGKVAEDRVKRMQTQYIKMGRDATGATKAMSITPLSLNMQDAATKTALAAQKQAIFNQLVKQGSTNLLNFGKNTQWAGRQLMVGFTVPLTYFGTVAAKTFMDLEAQAIRFKRVYGDMFTTNEQTTKALEDIQNLAKEFTKYGVAVAGTMQMAADAAATGKMGADLTAQVAEATRLAVLGGVEQQQALETTISLQNAFGVSADDLKKKIDFLNAVENQTVVNIEDLTIAIPKAGPVVKQLGGDVEDLAFFLTAMKEGGINASEGANALKSGLASLINPTKKAAEMLAGYGVNVKAIVEGNKGNLKETVVDFAEALNQLDPLNRAKAIEQMFGKFQFARLSTLFQNITAEGTQANRVLDLTGKSVEELAILSERELKTVEDAVGTNFKAAVEQLKLAIAPIGKVFLQSVTPIVKTLGDLFEKFNNLGDGTKKFLVLMTTLVGVIGPALLMTFGLLANGTANIIKLFLGLRTGFLKLTGDSKTLGATTNYLTAEQLEAQTVAASLNQAHTKLTQQFQLEATAVAALRNAYIQATVAAGNFAKANPGMMAPGKGGKPKKFASGATYVPGKGNKDTVPSVLTPGEAVIPRDVAQDPKFQPIIDAMVSGKLQAFGDGTNDARPSNIFGPNAKKFEGVSIGNGGPSYRGTIGGYRPLPGGDVPQKMPADNVNVDKKSPKKLKARAGEQYSHVGKSKYVPIAQILATPRLPQLDKDRLTVYRDILRANGQPEVISTRHNLAYSFPGADNRRMAGSGLPIEEWAKKWQASGAGKWISSNIPASQAMVVDDAILNKIIESGVTTVNDDIVEQAFKDLPDDVKKTTTYQKMQKLYSTTGEYTIGKGLGDTPETTRAVLDQAKKQGLIKDYEVRERFSKSKGKIVNSGITIITNDGKSVDIGRGSSGQRNPIKTSQDIQRRDVLVQPGETEVDPKTGKKRKITAANTKPKKAGTKRKGGNLKDTRVVSIRGRKVILPGAAFGMDENGNPLAGPSSQVRNIPFSNVPEQTRLKQSTVKQAQAVEEQTKAVQESTKSTKNLSAKFTGTANAFAGLTMLGSFMGGTVGELSQKLAPFAFGIAAIAQLLPALKSGFIKLGAALLANPWIAALAALAAIALAFKILDSRARKMAEAQSKYIDTISATTEKMKKVGELTGKVGASEVMARRREGGNSDKFTTGFDRAGQQFGTNFLESQVGKDILTTFKTDLSKGGIDAVRNIALELSAYVADGLMTAEDANSVARSIGINMSDMTISSNISGKLREIIGPDGQDILTSPLVVRLKIADESSANIAQAFEAYQSSYSGTSSKESKNAAAAIAASGAQSLEIIQAQRDGQNKLYDDQIRALQTQLSSTTDKQKQVDLESQISTLKKQQLSDDSKISAKRKQALDIQLKGFKAIRSREKLVIDKPDQSAFFASLKQQVKDKYKNDPLTSVFLDKAAKTNSLELEVAITTMVGSGDLTPNTATKLITMFGKGGEQKLETLLTTTFAAQDPGKVQSLINLATNIGGKGGKEIGLKLLTEIGAAGQEGKFDDRLNALTLLQKLDGKEINLGLFLKGDAVGKIDSLVPLLDKIEKLKTPITKDIILDLSKKDGMPDLQALADNWSYYENLPDDIKKTVTETYVSIYKTITDDNAASMARDEAQKRGLKGKSAAAFIKKNSSAGTLAQTLTQKIFPQGKAPNTIPGGGSSGADSSGNRDTTLDNLLNRLKMVRDASINAVGGIKELNKITSGSGITKFSGVLNQLMAGPAATQNRGFISFLESMDDQTRKTYMTIKSGKVILTQAGKNLAEAFNEQTLGDFNVAQKDTITQVNAQKAAFVKLKAAGVDTATALEMIADAELAIAINASVEPANKLKDMATSALSAKRAVQDLNLAFKQQMQTALEELETLKQLPGLIDKMNALGMSSEQVQAVLDDPNFAREMLNNLKEGATVSQDLLDYINSIPERKRIEIDIAMKTPEGMQKLFDDARGNAEEYFDVVEESVRIKFKKPIKDAENAVKSAQDAVSSIEDQIRSIEDSIDQKQRDIEINIDRKIEEYQGQVDSLQKQISSQFDKPIESLNDDSNKLSNDLSIMDHAAESINKKYDMQAEALTKIADINSEIANQQKQQLTLADALTQGDISAAAAAAQELRSTYAQNQSDSQQQALEAARKSEIESQVGPSGLTRSQIEERQYQISQQIYAIEQQRKIVQDQIVLIQETRIAPLEQARVASQNELRTLQDDIYQIEQGALKNAQQRLIEEQKKLDKINEQLDAELDAIEAQRDKWSQAQNAIDLARVKSDKFQSSMKFNESLVTSLVNAWNSLTSKNLILTVTEVRNVIVNTIAGTTTAPTTTTKTPTPTPTPTPAATKAPSYNPLSGTYDRSMYGGYVKKMASGGYVPGRGMIDKVPTLLTPGEFVVNRAAAKVFGPGLSKINESKYPTMLSKANVETPTYVTALSNVIAPSNLSSSSYTSNNSSTVYNYNLGITVAGSNSNPNDIARSVMKQIKNIDSQRIGAQRA